MQKKLSREKRKKKSNDLGGKRQSEKGNLQKWSKYGMESFFLSPGVKRNGEKKMKYRTKKRNNCFQLRSTEIKNRRSNLQAHNLNLIQN